MSFRSSPPTYSSNNNSSSNGTTHTNKKLCQHNHHRMQHQQMVSPPSSSTIMSTPKTFNSSLYCSNSSTIHSNHPVCSRRQPSRTKPPTGLFTYRITIARARLSSSTPTLNFPLTHLRLLRNHKHKPTCTMPTSSPNPSTWLLPTTADHHPSPQLNIQRPGNNSNSSSTLLL